MPTYTKCIERMPKLGEEINIKTYYLLDAQPICKIYQINEVVFYVHPRPVHKRIHKVEFDYLDQLLNIIKSSFVPFFLESPKLAQGCNPLGLFPFLPHERVMPTQKVLSNRIMHHPNQFKKRELAAKTYKLWNNGEESDPSFPFHLCKITHIQQSPPPSF